MHEYSFKSGCMINRPHRRKLNNWQIVPVVLWTISKLVIMNEMRFDEL